MDHSWSTSPCTVRLKKSNEKVLWVDYAHLIFQLDRLLSTHYSSVLKWINFSTSFSFAYIVSTLSWSWHCGPTCNHVNGCISVNNSARSKCLLGWQCTERIQIFMHMLDAELTSTKYKRVEEEAYKVSQWPFQTLIVNSSLDQPCCCTCHPITTGASPGIRQSFKAPSHFARCLPPATDPCEIPTCAFCWMQMGDTQLAIFQGLQLLFCISLG